MSEERSRLETEDELLGREVGIRLVGRARRQNIIISEVRGAAQRGITVEFKGDSGEFDGVGDGRLQIVDQFEILGATVDGEVPGGISLGGLTGIEEDVTVVDGIGGNARVRSARFARR